MSRGDRDRWNAKWRERAASGEMAIEPSPWVVSLDPVLPRRGRALDVAGGTGRHAVWLARRGLDVVLADISDDGMALADRAARAAGVSVSLVDVDLELGQIPDGPWAVILCVHYLQRSLFPAMAAGLAPGGLLVFCHQTRRNLERHAQPGPAYLLDEGEAPSLARAASLEIASFSEGWGDEGRHEARLVARRPEGP